MEKTTLGVTASLSAAFPTEPRTSGQPGRVQQWAGIRRRRWLPPDSSGALSSLQLHSQETARSHKCPLHFFSQVCDSGKFQFCVFHYARPLYAHSQVQAARLTSNKPGAVGAAPLRTFLLTGNSVLIFFLRKGTHVLRKRK